MVNGVPTAVTTDNADRRVDAVDEPSSAEPGPEALARGRGLIPARGPMPGWRTLPLDALPAGMAGCYWAVVVPGLQRHVSARRLTGPSRELVTGSGHRSRGRQPRFGWLVVRLAAVTAVPTAGVMCLSGVMSSNRLDAVIAEPMTAS